MQQLLRTSPTNNTNQTNNHYKPV